MKTFLTLLLMATAVSLHAQKNEIFLYPDGKSPGLKPDVSIKELNISKPGDIIRLKDVTNPSLTIFKPQKKTSDASVIICPGGGYAILAFDHEGLNLGEWFAKRGVTAFVLKYRLPQDELFDNAEIRPLQDAQQAFRYIRKNAASLGINPNKVGIMGFSAGGHLAASASTHFDKQVGEITDETISVRPDFSLLIYPVISFSDKFGHMGSRDNLIGQNPSIQKIEFYSNEKQVKKTTPPTFLVHAFDDWVNVENSISYYRALKKEGIASEMHLYDRGGHGFSLKKDNKGPVATWHVRMEEWLKLNGFM
ncbi:alpha/beta hydrolase fold domain-containing protein [Emticicia sp. CRIBPO]|uniref:alpha/beta hydrolase n=1 Tax=Emticicia sp. CRIBPO TaxID=2683258 RepID=UPI00141318D9|nr:alpha/beta hydrolase [Emticicia sp. CRIBPO]NBA85904.1 alpha/beta hydrolase fold domain-containing protein [Emticicia sp. CRIBPO]